MGDQVAAVPAAGGLAPLVTTGSMTGRNRIVMASDHADVSGKIGILTFHRCINYGAYWQTRFLLDALRAKGRDPVVIDHRSWRVNLMEWKWALSPGSPRTLTVGAFFGYSRKLLAFLRAGARLPLSPKVRLQGPETWPEFDTIIVGSDEVWNLEHPWYGGSQPFFGAALRARRLASYGASFGSHPCSKEIPLRHASLLRRFHAISVRDENSRELVRNAVGEIPTLVLDPCLITVELPAAPAVPARPSYAAVFGCDFSENFARQVREWAGARGVRLVGIGYHHAWVDEHRIDATPAEFLALMRGAHAVATNFFHGCVFALRYGLPFAAEASPYRSIKIAELLATMGDQARLIPGGAIEGSCAAQLGRPLTPAVLARLGALRRESDAYLDRILG